MSSCRLHCGAKRPAVLPTPIARFTFPTRPSSRRANQGAISKSFSIPPAAWIFATKMAGPLIKWSTPEEAFEAWKACTRGRPCDYTGLSYAKLSAGSGIAWPCNAAHPDGEHWPYKSLMFPSDADYCETFGHDLMTGAAISPEK